MLVILSGKTGYHGLRLDLRYPAGKEPHSRPLERCITGIFEIRVCAKKKGRRRTRNSVLLAQSMNGCFPGST